MRILKAVAYGPENNFKDSNNIASQRPWAFLFFGNGLSVILTFLHCGALHYQSQKAIVSRQLVIDKRSQPLATDTL